MSLLAIQNLSKVYESEGVATPALRGATLSVDEGEFVAVMGPSGSGKSTLLHLLGLLDVATSGSYTFKGKKVGEYSAVELAAIRNKEMGFVFQAFNLLPKSTVFENVLLPLFYSDIPESKWNSQVEDAIKSVELSHRRDYRATQLSGGEKQRVAIARALVQKPPLIFADEPTGNLDSHSGQVVMEILQKLNEERGHTIILITHESDTAAHARRVIKIHDGEIISDEEVRNRQHAGQFKK